MANNVRSIRLRRKIAHYGLAGLVMLFFVIGLVAIAGGRRLHAALDAWRPRSETALRTIDPGLRELRAVVRALMMFAEAVADEVLVACWNRRSQ